jgi:polygalacturonase
VPYEPLKPATAQSKVAWANGAAFNVSLNKLLPGDTLIVPNKTFHLVGGIIARNIRSATIQFDGTLVYAFEDTVSAAEEYIKTWPRSTASTQKKEGQVLECMHFFNFTNVKFTSTGMGTFEGRGQKWWGIPGIGYLKRTEDRPRLITIEGGSSNILFENLYLHESPYWTLDAHVSGMEIRNVHINNRRTNSDGHGVLDETAFK